MVLVCVSEDHSPYLSLKRAPGAAAGGGKLFIAEEPYFAIRIDGGETRSTGDASARE